MRKKNGQRALMLNADFSPIAMIPWKRAMVLSVLNQAEPSKGLEVVDYYEQSILTCGGKYMLIPSVVRSPYYIKQNKRRVSFSRSHVFLRDQLTCCYCNTQDITGKSLTYDHVIPRTAWKKMNYSGTPTQWNNIVTCCIYCNRKKGDKLLNQVDMKLIKEPKEPVPQQFILGLGPWSKIHPQWELYITPLYKSILAKRKITENVL